jgi:hypothetical protein
MHRFEGVLLPWQDRRSTMDDGLRTDGQRLEISTIDARQGTREGVVRYVLGISLTLVIVGFVVIYMIYAHPALH